MDNPFEARWLDLRQTGAGGWGGSSFNRRQAAWAADLAAWRADALLPEPPSLVLELGCGNGIVSEMLARMGYDVQGRDLSSTAVAWARDRFQALGLRGTFQHGDVREMSDLEGHRFELVVDGNCFHCLIGDDRAKCLAEVRRLLGAGGRFILSSMCGEPRSDEARRRFDSQCRHLIERGRPTRTLAPVDDLVRELQHAGLQVIWSHIAQNLWWDHLTAIAQAA